MKRTEELFHRFANALGGPNNVSDRERQGIILAAALIERAEEKDKISSAASLVAHQARELAEIALDALNLPGTAGRMLDRRD